MAFDAGLALEAGFAGAAAFARFEGGLEELAPFEAGARYISGC